MTALLARLKLALAWLAARPMVAGAITLGAAFLALFVRLRLTERQRDRARAGEATARVEGQAAVLHEKEAPIRETIRQAEETGAAAAESGRQAREAADSEVERRRKAAARWEP